MRRIDLGGQTVVMDSGQSLDSIAAEFGAPIFRNTYAPEDELRACIEVTHRGAARRLHLITNDLGGPKHHVMGYTVTAESEPSCVIPSIPLKLVTARLLYVGLAWEGSKKLLDNTPNSSADSLVYFWSVQRLDSSQGASPRRYDEFTRVVVRVRDGLLREFTVWYGEVN